MFGDHIDRFQRESAGLLASAPLSRRASRYNPRALLNLAPTKRLSALILATFAASLAIFPNAASAGVLWPDKGYSQAAETVNMLYAVVFGLGAIAIIVLVALLARAARTEVDADAAAVNAGESGKTALIAGTAAFVLLAVLGGMAFSKTSSADPSQDGVGNALKPEPLMSSQLKDPTGLKPPEGPSMSVRVNGQQYLWRYEYPSAKGKAWNTYTYSKLVIPVGVTVMLDVTSSDVEHSWWVPELGGSIDAVPGYINRGWIRVDKPGVTIFEGHSTKVSGTNYASMGTRVTAIPLEDWLTWAKGQNIEINAAMDALAEEVQAGDSGDRNIGEPAIKEGE